MKENPKKSTQDLEKDKLELEIRELSKPWYKKASYSVIITGLAVVGTIFFSWKSGFLDVRRERLDNEKLVLEMDIWEFSSRRDSLLLEMIHLHDSIQHIRDSLNLKETELIVSIEQNKKLRHEMFEAELDCKGMFNYYEKYIDSLIDVRIKSEAFDNILPDHNGIIITDHEGRSITYPGAGVMVYPKAQNDK